jgi:hypothetical protein
VPSRCGSRAARRRVRHPGAHPRDQVAPDDHLRRCSATGWWRSPVRANLVVLRTPPGTGQRGRLRPRSRRASSEVVGTVAGDDTVLVVVANRAVAASWSPHPPGRGPVIRPGRPSQPPSAPPIVGSGPDPNPRRLSEDLVTATPSPAPSNPRSHERTQPHEQGSMNVAKRVVLAYSGGLDTSVAVRWMIESSGSRSCRLAVDVGQARMTGTGSRASARAAGAIEAEVVDLPARSSPTTSWPPPSRPTPCTRGATHWSRRCRAR